MTRPTATKQQLARRVDRLVQSLVGVVRHVPAWNVQGRLVGIDILRHADVQEHQLVRNVVSGLGAGCGIRLDRTAVRVHDDADAFTAAVNPAVSPDAGLPAPAPHDAVAAGEADEVKANRNGHASGGNGHTNGHGQGNGHANGGANGHGNGGANGHGNGAANGHGNGSANGHSNGGARPGSEMRGITRPGMGVQAEDQDWKVRAPTPVAAAVRKQSPAEPDAARVRPRPLSAAERQVLPAESPGVMRLETLHVERHGGLLRCRVILALDVNRYSAIADMPDGPTAEAELVARVTLDAMRAGGFTGARLEAAGLATIGETTFVVVSIRDSGSGALRGGVAPLVDSVAHSAAAAALQGVGPITARQRDGIERELGRL